MGTREIPYFPIIQISFMMLTTKKTDKGDCVLESIVEEKLVSFKTLEQKVFAYRSNAHG